MATAQQFCLQYLLADTVGVATFFDVAVLSKAHRRKDSLKFKRNRWKVSLKVKKRRESKIRLFHGAVELIGIDAEAVRSFGVRLYQYSYLLV